MIPVPVTLADEGARGEGGAGGAGAAGRGGAGVRRVAPAAGRQHQHQPRRHHRLVAAEFKALTSLSGEDQLHSLPSWCSTVHCHPGGGEPYTGSAMSAMSTHLELSFLKYIIRH